MLSALSTRCAALVLALALTGCPALFPELSTPITAAPKDVELSPPPPPDRHYLEIKGAKIPEKTRDGRTWDSVFGSLPDPLLKIFVNDAEIIVTNSEANTLEPVWADAPRGNFAIAAGDKLEVQLWDANALASTAIGKRDQTLTADMIDSGQVELELSGGGRVTLAIGPARAVWGAGFWFELRNAGARISRVVDGSPASRAGLVDGDKVLQIDGKPTDGMSVNEIRSALAAIPSAGRALDVQHSDGSTLQVTIKEGPIYPLYKDYRKLPVVP